MHHKTLAQYVVHQQSDNTDVDRDVAELTEVLVTYQDSFDAEFLLPYITTLTWTLEEGLFNDEAVETYVKDFFKGIQHALAEKQWEHVLGAGRALAQRWRSLQARHIALIHRQLPCTTPEQRLAQRVIKQYYHQHNNFSLEELHHTQPHVLTELSKVIAQFMTMDTKKGVMNFHALSTLNAHGFQLERDAKTGTWLTFYEHIAGCLSVDASALCIKATESTLASWAAWWQAATPGQEHLDQANQQQHAQAMNNNLLYLMACSPSPSLPMAYWLYDEDIRYLLKLCLNDTSACIAALWSTKSLTAALMTLAQHPKAVGYIWINDGLDEPSTTGRHWFYLKVEKKNKQLRVSCFDSLGSPRLDTKIMREVVIPGYEWVPSKQSAFERQTDGWSCGFRVVMGIVRDSYHHGYLSQHDVEHRLSHLPDVQQLKTLISQPVEAPLDVEQARISLFSALLYQRAIPLDDIPGAMKERFEPHAQTYHFKPDYLQNFFPAPQPHRAADVIAALYQALQDFESRQALQEQSRETLCEELLDTVEQLLYPGVELDERVVYQKKSLQLTLLHYAVYLNHAEVVELLLRHHANVNAPANNAAGLAQSTPLHTAVAEGSLAIVEHLLAYGANIMALDGNHQRADELAPECSGTVNLVTSIEIEYI